MIGNMVFVCLWNEPFQSFKKQMHMNAGIKTFNRRSFMINDKQGKPAHLNSCTSLHSNLFIQFLFACLCVF